MSISRRRKGLGALLLSGALLSSLAVIAYPSGSASAADSSPAVSTAIRYGCATGDGDGNFVEVTLTTADPTTVQVGLARSADNTDTYLDGGPSMVELSSGATTVRLAGPVEPGAHVFVREDGQNTYRNYRLPASCQHVGKTDFKLVDPDVFYTTHQVVCSSTAQASLKVSVYNNNDVDVDYTVLLVRRDGLLSGTNPEGQLVTVPAQGKKILQLTQPPTGRVSYEYQARAIGPDGNALTVGAVVMHCESAGHPGSPKPTITPTPVRPTPRPTPTASSQPSSSAPAPSSNPPSTGRTATPTRPAPSGSTSATTSRTAVAPVPTGSPTSQPAVPGAPTSTGAGAGDGSAFTGGGGDGVGADSGPVLGDAGSTSQALPRPVASPSKQVLVEPARIQSFFRNPGFAGGALVVILVFAAALAGLLATNLAGARRH